tara:strand:+ start:153 stop:692 length:540 start_codon:yes stop_codon:yes gene_type:complete
MKNICVFAGSSAGLNSNHISISRKLGKFIAQKKYNLIYGGAKIGLMGEVASSCLSSGGNVIGVIPKFLSNIEVVHDGLSKLVTTETMHERKSYMYSDAEMFFILPGGVGTLEEAMEVLTWKQLGLINEKVYLINIDQYWDNLVLQLKSMVKNNFMKSNNLNNFIEIKNEKELHLIFEQK